MRNKPRALAGCIHSLLNQMLEFLDVLSAHIRRWCIAEVVRCTSKRNTSLEPACNKALYHGTKDRSRMEGNARVELFDCRKAAKVRNPCLHSDVVTQGVRCLIINQLDVV